MNVLEQHIEINISSQKIASNIFRKFDPNELDWILNKMVDRFVKDRIKEDKDSLGFDATEIDLDALRTLSVLDKVLPVYRDGSELELFADLPGNYSFLIDDSSGVVDKCSIYFPTASRFTNKTKYIYAYELKESGKGGTPYYQSVGIKLAGADLLAITEIPGLPRKEELFTFRDYLLNKLWDLKLTGTEIYWQEYAGIYKRNCILIVTDTEQSGANSITIDETAPVNATQSTIVRAYPAQLTTGVRNKNNRLIKGQVRANVLDGTFTGTQKDSPISAVTGRKLKVYYGEKFIVNRLKISYIKKPRKISLSLGQDCDLPEEFHMQICDMAVLYIKELTMSPDWEVKLQDNMMNKN